MENPFLAGRNLGSLAEKLFIKKKKRLKIESRDYFLLNIFVESYSYAGR